MINLAERQIMNKQTKIDIELDIESLRFDIEQIINSPIKKRKSNIDIVLKTIESFYKRTSSIAFRF